MKRFTDEMHNETLFQEIIDQVLKHNLHLKAGDYMPAPVALAKDGKIVKDIEDEQHFPIPDVKTIRAVSVKVWLPLGDLSGLRISQVEGTWLHPYMCMDMNKRFASQSFPPLVLGEKTTVADPKTFEPKEVVVTQEMIDAMNYAIFRFAVS